MKHDVELDARGLACPLPLLKTKQSLRHMTTGQVLWVRATDAGSWRDIPVFVKHSAHQLVGQQEVDGAFEYWISKGAD
ncbi:sulfurtransferase TusA family protein [Balneatrix alpica]|uniref:Sulfurtransferase TusA family protein n=1 Tax=Balneatrix alpica TaxID=75684 RepID=A0ABV5Z6T2_9GAMM|nr:sulfurtransferase TusA family protein [Balneatrix alpica]